MATGNKFQLADDLGTKLERVASCLLRSPLLIPIPVASLVLYGKLEEKCSLKYTGLP